MKNRYQHSRRSQHAVFAISVLASTLLIPFGHLAAGPSRQKAMANVAVAIAQVQIANDRPELPNRTRPSNSFEPRDAQDVQPGMEAARGSSISISFNKVANIHEVLPAQLVISVWERGCIPCRRQEEEINRVLKPLNWTIGNAATDQIRFVHVPKETAVPHIELFQNGQLVKDWDGYQEPALLSFELRNAWDKAPGLLPSVQTSSGIAGSIHGQTQIRSAIDWFRRHVGEGVTAEWKWDRSGTQSLPLLARGDWSAMALFGGYGHMHLSAPDAIGLPVKTIGFTYRIRGDDVAIDLDDINFPGLALSLGPNLPMRSSECSGTASAPPQLGILTAWSIVSMIKEVWSILHPTCDLQLGGSVGASAVLRNDQLEIDFQQPPTIKLVALFSFQLSVKRVEINERSVRIIFGGSRLVHERTFSVD